MASQLHKLNVRGGNSAFQRKALAKSVDQYGTDTDVATVELDGDWSGADSITVTTNIGASDVDSVYSPSGNESAEAAATALAAVVNGQLDHTAVSAANVVQITKTTAGTVRVVSAVV